MASKAIELIETQHEYEKGMLTERLREATNAIAQSDMERERLTEALGRLDMYLDSRGWSDVTGMNDAGPSLDQLHKASMRIRDQRAMNTHVKRGLDLRAAYIWNGGIHYDMARIPGSGRGRGANVKERINNPINQKYFFSQAARERREAALYCDSQPFYVGDESDWTVRSIPISEITADYRNPDQNDEIWAYRRTWSHYAQGSTNPETKHEWIFVNGFTNKRTTEISWNNEVQTVSQTKRIFGTPVNGNDGWAYGMPDALAGLGWTEQYRQFMLKGIAMSSAMSDIWAVAKQNSQAGADNASMKIGGATGGGQTAVIGASNSLSPLSTAGQSYAFEKGVSILANFATSIGVSIVALTSNPGDAGSSYSAAQALDLPEQLTTTARRQYHIDLDREVLVWLGAPDDIDIWFDSLMPETEAYRRDQRIALRLGTGLFEGEEAKAEFVNADGKTTVSKVPEGFLLPNNEESLARKDIDTDTSAASGGNLTPTQGSPAQFTGGGSGDQSADDIR